MRRVLPILLLMFCACANETDETENILVIEKAEGACGVCQQQGAFYRFTELKLTELVGGTEGLYAALNGAWATDIKKHELNIYMEVISNDGSKIEFRLVNGARVGSDETCLMDETEVALIQPIETDGLGASEPTTFNVFAGSQAHPKNCNVASVLHAIPVNNVVVTSKCSESCDPIENDSISGEFNGSLTQSGLNSTCTCLDLSQDKLSDESCGDFSADYVDTVNDGACNGCGPKYLHLGTLVPQFNVNEEGSQELNFSSCQAQAGEPAVCLKAVFAAYRIADADIPPPCQ